MLLNDQSGWSWQTGPGQALSVRFEPAAAKVYFEKNQKIDDPDVLRRRFHEGRARAASA